MITPIQLSELITESTYINACKANKGKDPSSLSSLIQKPLSQSECIRLGIAIEKFLQEVVIKYTQLVSIKPKNKSGVKERDHLFSDDIHKIVYYAELKANINLDTEKSKSTCKKCLEIVQELSQTYPGYTIRWCLLGYRYKHYNDIPKTIQNKYTEIKDNLYGINQYLEMINLNLQFTNETYVSLLNQIANKMFN